MGLGKWGKGGKKEWDFAEEEERRETEEEDGSGV